MIPSVFPRTSQQPAETLFQTPWCISMLLSLICLAKVMISAMTSSATDLEFENGELNTQIPLLAAYWRSTWLVPIQKQPMTMRFFACLRTLAVNFVFERIPMTWTSLNTCVSVGSSDCRMSH